MTDTAPGSFSGQVLLARPSEGSHGYRRAVAMLLAAAVCWGAGNVANKTLLSDIGPLTALTLRLAVAALVILPFLKTERAGRLSMSSITSVVPLTAAFILASAFQQMAYRWTTVTNVGFLANTCTVLTPLVAWLIMREGMERRVIGAAAVTFVGAGLMTGASPEAGLSMNAGDACALASALFYAVGAVLVGQHLMRHGLPVMTTFVQFVVSAVFVAPFALWVEHPTVQGIVAAGPEILFLAVFSTAGAFLLMTLAQRHISAPVAVMVVSLESVVGAAGGVILLGESLSPARQAGALLILAAVTMAVMPKPTRA
jgi:drug/metabolite transporter (DMT)-like permease